MVKKKINRKKNKGLCKVNYFKGGGPKLGNVLLGGIGTAAGSIGGNYLSNDRTSYAGSAISGIGSTVGTAVSAVNPLLGGIISGASGLVGGALNNILGSSLNEEKINEIKQANEAMNQLSIDNSTLDSVMNQWGSVNFGNAFSQSDIGSDGIFGHKASRAYNRLKLQQDTARNRATSALMGAATAANTNANLNILSNFAAKGGYLFEDGGHLEGVDFDSAPIPFDISIEGNNAPIEKIDNTPQKPLRKSYGAIPEKPFAQNKNQFLNNWLNKRSGILQNNINSAGINTTSQQELDRQLGNLNKTIEITSTIPDYLDSENLAILGYDAARESKDKNVKNAASAVKDLVKEADKQGGYDYEGIYSPKENVIFYPERLSANTMLHERTHALQATPQKRAIQQLLDAGDYLQEGQTPDDYYDNPSEIYSRLMEFRLNSNINPEDRFNNRMDILNKAIDPNYRKESFEEFKQTGDYKNLIGRYKTDFLLKLLNDVAQNDMNNDNVNYAANGGSINIKPSRKGTFTAAAKRHGKGVQEFATHVLANKEDYSPAMVKKANFARNASKWKHAFGGDLLTHGAEWDNGVTVIGNGGTHEENPMEGVQMGVDNQGIPNLVEEGEVIFNDYVFSNRLTVPNTVKEKYKLRGNKELTFADAAKQMQKESEERPNDPISKRGLLSSMSRLQQAQEIVRQQDKEGQEGVQYAKGGKRGTLFDGKVPLFVDEKSFYNGFIPSYVDWASSKSADTPVFGVDWHPTGKISYTKGETSPNYQVREASVPTSFWRALDKNSEEQNKYVHRAPIKDDNPSTSIDNASDLSWLRYAPVAGAALGLGLNLFNNPDYSNADAVLEAANQAGNYTPVGYTPIGNYLTYKPFDRNYYINKLNAQAGATRRAIMNTSSLSRDAALLAADYNAQGRLGDLARQAEEYNLAQRQAVETFNRATNQANAEMGLKAAMANQEAALKARSSRLSGVAQAMAMRDAIDAKRDASMSANLTNLFESLGNIGVDEMNRADSNFYIKYVMGANLPLEEYRRRFGLDAAKKEAKNRGFTDDEITKLFKTNKKKRGGFTY